MRPMDEMMESEPFVYYDGGDGSSMEDAVVIHGTGSEPNAVAAEYAYIARMYGRGCMRDRQSIGHEDGHWYDILEIILPNGSRTTLHFDITEQFLGDLRGRLADAFVGNEAVVGKLDDALQRSIAEMDRHDEERIPNVVKAAGITAAVVVIGVAVQTFFGKKKHRRVAA